MTCPTCNGKHWCNCGSRNTITIAPEQYHNGLDLLWKALSSIGNVKSDNVFQICHDAINDQQKEIDQLKEDLKRCIPYLIGHCDGYDEACNKLRRELINKWDLKAGD